MLDFVKGALKLVVGFCLCFGLLIVVVRVMLSPEKDENTGTLSDGREISDVVADARRMVAAVCRSSRIAKSWTPNSDYAFNLRMQSAAVDTAGLQAEMDRKYPKGSEPRPIFDRAWGQEYAKISDCRH